MLTKLDYRRLPLASYNGRIFFGPLPSAEVLSQLREEGIHAIWNLMAELPALFEVERQMFPASINTQIPDYNIPDGEQFKQDLERICKHVIEGRDVFIHCFGGHGRTGMALAAVGMKLLSLPAEVALAFAKAHCSGPEMDIQKIFIRELSI